MHLKRRLALLSGAFMFTAAFALPAKAQDYPTKPIKMIVPFAVGGTTDVIARILAEGLTKELGQSVFVESRGGGGGSIGAREIARSKADGYTIGIATVSTHGINPAVLKSLGYDVLKDFTPVSMLISFPGGILVNPSFPAKDFQGFMKLVKASPGKYSYGSSGTGGGTHVAMELFKSKTGVFITHIPYRGSGPATNDVVAGQLPILWAELPTSLPLIKSGQLVAIGVAAKERSPLLPNVPTFMEMGVKDYEAELWNGLVGPPNLPPVVVSRLNAAVLQVFKRPDVLARLEQMGATVRAGSPQDFSSLIRSEVTKWTEVAKFANISVE